MVADTTKGWVDGFKVAIQSRLFSKEGDLIITFVLVTGVYIFDKYISVGNGYTKNTGKKNIYYHNNDAPIIDLNSIALLH